MTNPADPMLLVLIGGIAFLYASVGHAGASGYIAVLSLVGWTPAQVRPVVLLLNILVAAVATLKFYRAGHFRPRLFLPLAALSVPAAALGGYMPIPTLWLSRFIGAVLLFSAIWLSMAKREPEGVAPPGNKSALTAGGFIGFLSGLSGTGGGIFLSPFMLYFRWAKLKEISAIAAPYILLNSAAGLVGMNFSGFTPPSGWWLYAGTAVLCGTAGAGYGTRVLNVRVIQVLLASVLSIAAAKLLLLAH